MNIHHLELFYYVAKHRGISPAARFMPYGIQQPAISSQLLDLEKNLKVKLFQRRPFSLTPAGEKLYAFVTPFFRELTATEERLRGQISQHLHLAASPTLLRDVVPELVDKMRTQFPQLRLSTREIPPVEAETILNQHNVDLAVTVLEHQPALGLQCRKLIALPMILLVPKQSSYRAASEIFRPEVFRKEILISLPVWETLPKLFNDKLRLKKMEWLPGIEVNSVEVIQDYVLRDFGIGLSIQLPHKSIPKGLRPIPLPGFPPIVVAALWRGKLSPIAEEFLKQLQARADALAG
jgi:DNA-binding transcriptional LysR family regulator